MECFNTNPNIIIIFQDIFFVFTILNSHDKTFSNLFRYFNNVGADFPYHKISFVNKIKKNKQFRRILDGRKVEIIYFLSNISTTSK